MTVSIEPFKVKVIPIIKNKQKDTSQRLLV